jgi:hypothetical protein
MIQPNNTSDTLTTRRKSTHVPYRAYVSREPYGFSVEDIEQTAALFDGQPVDFVKKTYHELTLISPIEIYGAVKRSKKYGDADMRTVAHELFSRFTATSRQRAYAGIDGIDQFGEWISIILDDPTYQVEREKLQEELRSMTDVYVKFERRHPHISLAKGALANLNNTDTILNSLPAVVEFGSPKLYTKAPKKN